MEKIIDIGINLTNKRYENDRDDVIKRAKDSGVYPLIITGTSVKESRKAFEMTLKYPNVLYSTAGVHPHDTKQCTSSTIEDIRRLSKLTQVVAIGECGLDYDRDFSPRDIQREWFEKQVVLAEELDMPLFLHERAAFKDFKNIMSKHKDMCRRSVVHCFTGTGAELRTYIDMGFYIGITGWICDERRGTNLRTLIKMIPIEKLMIETDGPFLIPRNMKNAPSNRRNEPAFLRHILKDISLCLGKSEEYVSKMTYDNSIRFFKI